MNKPIKALRLGLRVVATLVPMAASAEMAAVFPDDPEGTPLVDLHSITAAGRDAKTKEPIYSATVRHQVMPQEAPSKQKFAPDAVLTESVWVTCGNGAHQSTLKQHVRPSQGVAFTKAVPSGRALAELRRLQAVAPGVYNQSAAGLVCAALAARCRGTPLEWPVPRNGPVFGLPTPDSPEEASQRRATVKAVSAIYARRFKPTCAPARNAKGH